MSRPRRLRCVFAVLLGWALLAGAFAGAAAAQPAAGQGLVRAVGPAGPGSDLAAAFAHADSPGPACAPGSPGRDGLPALPVRAGADQAQAPPAGSPSGVPGRPHAIPVRVPVHGPGQSAPSPLELSVMRV
ncbi:hypothetical protein ACFXDJ_01500 [Streptomyces sp. NPDC059443]|uniref:hypothetical protein n=1 Tax=unclassified Streptomyces TaxID=2593676 RepID=UPI0036A68B89